MSVIGRLVGVRNASLTLEETAEVKEEEGHII